jgi:hypothetical protein
VGEGGDVTDVYMRLDYRAYKHLEDQLKRWKELETVHTTVSGYYHKALRVEVGDLTIEFQGPAVREPVKEDAKKKEADIPTKHCGDRFAHRPHYHGTPPIPSYCGGHAYDRT